MYREENYLLVTATPLMLDAEATYELKRRSRRKTKETYSIREAAMLNTRVLCPGDWVSLVSELDRGKLVICFPPNGQVRCAYTSRIFSPPFRVVDRPFFRVRYVWEEFRVLTFSLKNES